LARSRNMRFDAAPSLPPDLCRQFFVHVCPSPLDTEVPDSRCEPLKSLSRADRQPNEVSTSPELWRFLFVPTTH
jgi:hypothetical protein